MITRNRLPEDVALRVADRLIQMRVNESPAHVNFAHKLVHFQLIQESNEILSVVRGVIQ